ncbi:unnamed protein product [Heligmosomoides polygyrus]|uniref:ATP-dependent DNA helicase n=1 Tax=Heligmosomoides polygyrus TaxID=6339 RepID=A0A3P8DHX2_HELPZ|nr:unnamed protein product [Heligmosomoides polygyrus]
MGGMRRLTLSHAPESHKCIEWGGAMRFLIALIPLIAAPPLARHARINAVPVRVLKPLLHEFVSNDEMDQRLASCLNVDQRQAHALPPVLIMDIEEAAADLAGRDVNIKYLFKHVYKRPDRARIHIYQPNNDAAETIRDEIEAYIDARYVRAPEAVYPILGFKMQDRIVDNVLLAIERQQGQCFFFDGSGGSGKTFVYTTVYHLATARRKRILNVAWTGIAANLLPNGRTVTSAFHLLVDDRSSSSGIKRQSKEAKTLREVDAIIWDEAPMAPKQALEAANSLLQDITQKNEPFGGEIMPHGGDFRQVLPVVEKGSCRDFVEVYLKMSVLWPIFKTHKLTTNRRLNENDYCHREWLLKIGNGEIPTDENEASKFRMI